MSNDFLRNMYGRKDDIDADAEDVSDMYRETDDVPEKNKTPKIALDDLYSETEELRSIVKKHAKHIVSLNNKHSDAETAPTSDGVDTSGLYSETESLRFLVKKQADTIANLKRKGSTHENNIRSLNRSLKNLATDLDRVRKELDHKIDVRD